LDINNNVGYDHTILSSQNKSWMQLSEEATTSSFSLKQ
jgi:hypothetical protein